MGTRGPVPTRTDQRRRRNKNADGPPTTIVAAEVAPAVIPAPEAEVDWHPMIADWYRSLATSGQSIFYEASDWQTARIWAEVMSRQLKGGRMSAQMVAAWSAASTELLTTEGARRRARVELQAHTVDEDEEASVTAIAGYRAKLNA